MFQDASVFNRNIGGWDTSRVTGMTSMFQNASVFNQDLSVWDVSLINTEPTSFDLQVPPGAIVPIWGSIGGVYDHCYNPNNAGEIDDPFWTGFAGMYIVENMQELKGATNYIITYGGTSYFFGDSDNIILTR